MTSCNCLSLQLFLSCADPCRLFCKLGSTAVGYGIVADGTRCRKDPSIFDVCITGVCKVTYLNIMRFRYGRIELLKGLNIGRQI